MLAIILLTLLSLFTPVFGFNKASISTALSNAVPALIVLLVLIVLASPFAYFTVHRLRLEVERTHRKLRHSKATVESLSHRYSLRTNHTKSPQEQTNNTVLKEQLDISLATAEELKSYITTMAVHRARIADDARNLKDMLDEAIQQKLVFERRAQVSMGETQVQAKRAEDATGRVYQLECRLEEKDAELYDAQCRAKKVNDLEGWVEDLKEENKVLRHLVCEYQTAVSEKGRTIQGLKGEDEVRAAQLEASNTISHRLHIGTGGDEPVKNDIQAVREEVSTTTTNIDNTLLATSTTFATNIIKHIKPPAHSTPRSAYSVPINNTLCAATMIDNHTQSSTKASEIPDYNIEGSDPSSPVFSTPSLVCDTNSNGSDCDSESTISSPIFPAPFLVSDNGNADINDPDCTSDSGSFTPESTFTSFPSPNTIATTSAFTDPSMLKTARHAYWKTIWAMKFASVKGED